MLDGMLACSCVYVHISCLLYSKLTADCTGYTSSFVHMVVSITLGKSSIDISGVHGIAHAWHNTAGPLGSAVLWFFGRLSGSPSYMDVCALSAFIAGRFESGLGLQEWSSRRGICSIWRPSAVII